MNFWQKLISYPKYYWKSSSQDFFLFTTMVNSYWLTEMMIYLLDIDIEADFKVEYHGYFGYFGDIHITNDFTALHHAAERGNVEVVRLLIDQGANIGAQIRISHSQAIHLAVERGRCEVVELLLDRGVDIETKDRDDGTALHRAVSTGHVHMVELLLDRGASIEAKNEQRNDETPLHRAVSMCYIHMVELLLDRGASIEAKDKYGQTAIHKVISMGMPYEAGDDFQIVKLLLDRGANIEAKDERGQTALHHAASRNNRILKLLLDRGASIEAKDKRGQTALHEAARNGDYEVVQLLLDRGADIEAKDERGQTALHPFFLGNDTSYDKYHQYHKMKLLLDKGANIEAKDDDNKTPIDLAIDAFEYDASLIVLFASYGGAVSKNNKDRLKKYHSKGASDNLADIVLKSSLEYHTDIKAPKLSRASAINSFEQALVLTSNNSNTGSQFLPADTAAYVISYLQDEIIHPNTNNQLANLASEVNNAASFEPDSITNKIKDILKQGAQVTHQKSITLAAIEQRYR